MAGNAYGEEEEVFYCADIASNGFRYDHQLKEYVPARFKERKFKMQLKYPASEIEILLSLRYDNGERQYFYCELASKSSDEQLVSCNSLTHGYKINFNKRTGRYAFSHHYGYVGGDNDSLAIVYGKCDKF